MKNKIDGIKKELCKYEPLSPMIAGRGEKTVIKNTIERILEEFDSESLPIEFQMEYNLRNIVKKYYKEHLRAKIEKALTQAVEEERERVVKIIDNMKLVNCENTSTIFALNNYVRMSDIKILKDKLNNI